MAGCLNDQVTLVAETGAGDWETHITIPLRAT